jgi:hypothetical protein
MDGSVRFLFDPDGAFADDCGFSPSRYTKASDEDGEDSGGADTVFGTVDQLIPSCWICSHDPFNMATSIRQHHRWSVTAGNQYRLRREPDATQPHRSNESPWEWSGINVYLFLRCFLWTSLNGRQTRDENQNDHCVSGSICGTPRKISTRVHDWECRAPIISRWVGSGNHPREDDGH